MVVGPEFGPIAGSASAFVQRRRHLAARSLVALAAGFSLAITAVSHHARFPDHGLNTQQPPRASQLVERDLQPRLLHVLRRRLRRAWRMLRCSAKSGALIGVLISVTTIPAAANIGVAAAYGTGTRAPARSRSSRINLASIMAAGTATLYVQRLLYRRRRVRHLRDPVARRRAGDWALAAVQANGACDRGRTPPRKRAIGQTGRRYRIEARREPRAGRTGVRVGRQGEARTAGTQRLPCARSHWASAPSDCSFEVASANARIGGTRACIRWTRGWTPRPSSCRSSVRRRVPASGALHVRESGNRLWKARPRAPSGSAACGRRDSNPDLRIMIPA